MTTAAVPSTDPVDFLLNVETLDEAINSIGPNLVDRLGNTHSTLNGAINSLKAFNVRGAWVTATAYAIKDVYTSAGLAYVTVVAHTSTSIAADLSAGYVTVHQGMTREDLAASSGAALVGYLPDGVGAVPKTVERQLRNFVCVCDYMSAAQEADFLSRGNTLDIIDCINKATAHVASLGGGTVWCPPGAGRVSGPILGRNYVKIEGAYGETTAFGAPYDLGTKFSWYGAESGVMLDCFGVRLFKIDGVVLDGSNTPGITGILVDSDNNPSGSQNEFHRFSIRQCMLGVQWGTSGIASPGSYANDGTRFTTFTIWSQMIGSKGFVVNSGNAGQMSTIESGGIQVDSIGIDIVVANLLQVRRVFGGSALKIGFIRVSTAIDLLVEGCSSEGQGSRVDGKISNDSYFLISVPPVSGYPVMQAVITLTGNRINNPVLLNSPVRINDTGNSWGQCYRISDGAIIPVTATATSGLSSVVAINNGAPIADAYNYGWQDSGFLNLAIIDPQRAWSIPAFVPGDYTGSGSMTWTVEPGDVETFSYQIIGRTMTVSFKLNSTTVGGTLNSLLNMKIPGGKVASVGMLTVIRLLDNGASVAGFCYVSGGLTTITIQRMDTANFSASTNATGIQGQITFQVN